MALLSMRFVQSSQCGDKMFVPVERLPLNSRFILRGCLTHCVVPGICFFGRGSLRLRNDMQPCFGGSRQLGIAPLGDQHQAMIILTIEEHIEPHKQVRFRIIRRSGQLLLRLPQRFGLLLALSERLGEIEGIILIWKTRAAVIMTIAIAIGSMLSMIVKPIFEAVVTRIIG